MSWKPQSCTAITIVIIVTMATFLAQAQNKYNELKDQTESVQTSGIEQQPQIDYVNVIRAEYGVPALTVDTGLKDAAEARVDDMIARNYWSHEDPDGNPFYTTIEKVRPGLRYLGENIGECFVSYDQLYKLYRESPTHLETIINANFTVFGGSTQWNDTENCFVNANTFGGN